MAGDPITTAQPLSPPERAGEAVAQQYRDRIDSGDMSVSEAVGHLLDRPSTSSGDTHPSGEDEPWLNPQ